jgi:UDP-glucose:(heptosyl)LPS alpha-1,3-glucosyltransferase
MRIAFGIVSLFPGGGLQRDCLAIARSIQSYCEVLLIYTARLSDGVQADDIPVIQLPNNAKSNHQRQLKFALDFDDAVAGRFDLIVAFDKIIGADVLFCADASVLYRMKGNLHLRLLPRYRTFTRLEGESFRPNSRTKIILLSQDQLSKYRVAWNTEPDRLILIPPTIASARRKPVLRTNGMRHILRANLGLTQDTWVWIAVGVQPKTKGLDRTVRALAHFDHAHLLIVGLDEESKASEKLVNRGFYRRVRSRITWLGHREDIALLFAAADLFVHPARYDTTGAVILEAMINGVPVVTTSACGYATHVDAAQAGAVIQEPFDFQMFLSALSEAREGSRRVAWSLSGIDYGQHTSIYEGRTRAAEVILAAARKRKGENVAAEGLGKRLIPNIALSRKRL